MLGFAVGKFGVLRIRVRNLTLEPIACILFFCPVNFTTTLYIAVDRIDQWIVVGEVKPLDFV